MKSIKSAKRKRTAIAVLIAIVVLATIVAAPVYAADTGNDDLRQIYDRHVAELGAAKCGGLGVFAYKICCIAQGAHPDYSLESAMTALLQIGRYSPGLRAVEEVYNGAKVIGITLMVLYFFLGIVDRIQMDQFTNEQLYKKLIGLCIAIVVIMNGNYILNWIINICDAMTLDLAASSSLSMYSMTSGNSPQTVFDELKDAHWIMAIVLSIGFIAENLIPALVKFITIIGIMFAMISRILQITVRYALAPIGIAPIVSDGLRSSGVRYIKKFASVCIQGVAIVAVLYLSNIIDQGSQSATGVLREAFGKFIMPIAVLGAAFKMERIADDVLGV